MKKHFFFLFALLTTCFAPLLAQQQGPAPQGKAGLEGTWQLCKFQKNDSGKYDLHVLPVLKIVQSDGRYQTLLIFSRGCNIGEQGTYKTENDSILVETPMASPNETANVKKGIFHLQGPQWMVIDRKSTEGGTTDHEIWMRLRQTPEATQTITDMLEGKVPKGGPHMQGGPGQRPEGGDKGNFKRGNKNQQSKDIPRTNSDVDNSWMNQD